MICYARHLGKAIAPEELLRKTSSQKTTIKHRTLIAIVVACATSLGFSQTEPTEPVDSGYYQFVGADLRGKRSASFYPIVGSDRRGVYVELENGKRKRVRYNSDFALSLALAVSKDFVEVDQIKPVFSSSGKIRRQSAMLNTVMDASTATDMAVADVNRSVAAEGITPAQAQAEITELHQSQRDFEDQMRTIIDNDQMSPNAYSDTLSLDLTLRPKRDIDHAFCVVVIPFNRKTAAGKTEHAVKAGAVGELLGGVPNEVSLRFPLVSGKYDPSAMRFFLFSEDGTPVATSESAMLRPLSRDQMDALAAAARSARETNEPSETDE